MPNRKKPRKNKPNPGIEKGINPSSFYGETPAWRLSLLDRDDKWAIKSFNEDFIDHILEKFKDWESMTWNEIISASGGRSEGNNSHFVKISEIIIPAQKLLKI